jgi:hypothetical protein
VNGTCSKRGLDLKYRDNRDRHDFCGSTETLEQRDHKKLYGAPRIRRESLMLGIEVAESIIRR